MSNFVQNYELLGMGEDEETVFGLWPNPSLGTVTVEGKGRLAVSNLLGQRVLDADLDGKLTLTLPSGMYLVRLANGSISETRKVVVK